MSSPSTADAFLGGRLTIRQPTGGFRSGMDAVILAAAVPARAGDRCVDFGTGTGAAALCLAQRVRGASVTGIEIDHAVARMAQSNAAGSGLPVVCIQGCAEDAGPPQGFDHVLANPPFYLEGREDGSPVAARRRAVLGSETLLADWTKAAQRVLKPKGTLTMILPADRLGHALAALGKGWGGIVLAPLWPRAGEPAKRVLVRALKGSRAALRLTSGLVLHDGQGHTPEAEAILRDGSALSF